MASAVAEGLGEEGLGLLHLHAYAAAGPAGMAASALRMGCAMTHHIAMVMRRTRRAARAQRVARAQSARVAGRRAAAATAAAAVAAVELVAAAAWQALSLLVDWRVGLALGRNQS